LIPFLTGVRKGDIHESLYWRWLEGANPRSVHAVRRGDWRLMKVREEDPWQLYDIKADPGETTDLAAEYPRIVDDLALDYEEWVATLPPPSGKSREPGGRMPSGIGWATPDDP
jgi:arylsulfatase